MPAMTESPSTGSEGLFEFEIWSAHRDSGFYDQVEAIKEVASWTGQYWYCRVDRADTERLAKVVNHLFTVAAEYGTSVRMVVPDQAQD